MYSVQIIFMGEWCRVGRLFDSAKEAENHADAWQNFWVGRNKRRLIRVAKVESEATVYEG